MTVDVFHPTSFYAGIDWETGEAVSLPLDLFGGRTTEVTAGSGSGKSSLITEFLRSIALTDQAYVYFDYAQTGSDYMQTFDAFVAQYIRDGIEIPFGARLPELVGSSDAFIARHAYVDVGEANPAVRINPLRRCRFQDGSVEKPEEVAQRFDNVWDSYFGRESKQRVQFKRYLTCISALLAAADGNISEFVDLLEHAAFRETLRERQRANGTFDDDYVQRQWAVLDGVLSLTTQHGNATKEQRDELHSLRNALEPLASGSLKAFFRDETFHLEDVAYGNKRLHLAVAALNSDSMKKFVMCAVWSMLDTLIEKRRWADGDPIGLEIVDEPNWLPEMFFQRITLRRNKRWASIVLRQTEDAQFKMMGLPQAAEILRASSACRIHGRKESIVAAEELAYRMRQFTSDVFIQKVVESVSASEAAGISGGTSDTITEGAGRGTGSQTGKAKTTNHLGQVSITESSGSSVHEDTSTAKSTGTQTGESQTTTFGKTQTYQWHRITPQEQHMLLAQSLLRLPNYVVVIEIGDAIHVVLLEPPREFPRNEVVEAYIERNKSLFRPRPQLSEPSPLLHLLAQHEPLALHRAPNVSRVETPTIPAKTGPWRPPKKR